MAKWTFEPGHTAAEFRARHMMVTYVRGHFKNIQGTLEFDPEDPTNSSVEVRIDAKAIWSGVQQRDDHLRSSDFLDAENHPEITFKGNQVEVKGEHDFAVTGDLTIRGVTRDISLTVIPRTMGDALVGRWSRQGTEDTRGFPRCHADQSPGLLASAGKTLWTAAGLSWGMKSISSSMLRRYLKIEAYQRRTEVEGRSKK